jgi:ABC-type branched-subunit amino acid transport system ATPase component
MTEPALRIRGLSKSFDKPVITGLDLEIGAGQLYALLGPNGAGKTTTLRMVAGLTRQDAGTIHIYGISARQHPNEAKAITAWLPDEPMLYDKLTPSEYLAFVAGMIAQVQMLAPSKPSMTIFTTRSAWRKSATGDIVAASVLKNTSFTLPDPSGQRGAGMPRSILLAAASACQIHRPAPQSPPPRSVSEHRA